jgi:magnesium transporter
MVSNCWINVECQPKPKNNYVLEKLQIQKHFTTLKILTKTRIELENGWTLIIMRIPVKSNDVKLPFHTIPVGLFSRGEVCYVELS